MLTRNALPDPLTSRFLAGLARHAPRAAAAIIGDKSPFVCAVSGGGDSLALLVLAAEAFPGQCHIATVDHGLREEAEKEAAYVATVCRQLDVSHIILKAPMPSRTNKSANISARARTLRYQLLEAHRIAVGANTILTAHHADDQLETLVMRLNRGAGLRGLAGIRGEFGTIARPLLDWRHTELLDMLKDRHINWVEDPSNSDERYDRARLRTVLATNDLFDPLAVSQSVYHLAQADRIVEQLVDHAMDSAMNNGESIVLDLDSHPIEIQRRLTLRCLSAIMPDACPRHDQIEHLWACVRAGKAATLAGVKVDQASVNNGLGARNLWRFAKARPRTLHNPQ